MFYESIGFSQNVKVRASLDNIVQYPVHAHSDALEIICILDGAVSISDSALNYKLCKDDVYIFNAKDPHKITTISEKNVILTVQIGLSHYRRYYKNLDVIYFICDSFLHKNNLFSELKYLRFLLSKIYFSYQMPSVNGSELESCTRNLLEFLMEQFQYYTYSKSKNNSYDIIRRQQVQSNDPYSNRIYEIINYIYACFSTKIKLEHIANQQFLSIYYLSRYIKKACGLSFSELVSIARCEEAERLLGSTEKTIDEIALEVGFSNRKHLHTQFKKWYLKSPSEYRKLLKENVKGQQNIIIQNFDNLEAETRLKKYLV